MSKSILQLAQQFKQTFENELIKSKKLGFTDEQALQLAISTFTHNMARSFNETQNFHAAQIGFKEKRIKDLEAQVARQRKMLDELM